MNTFSSFHQLVELAFAEATSSGDRLGYLDSVSFLADALLTMSSEMDPQEMIEIRKIGISAARAASLLREAEQAEIEFHDLLRGEGREHKSGGDGERE